MLNFVQQVFFLLPTEGSLVITRAYPTLYLGGTPSQKTNTIPLAVYSSRTIYRCRQPPPSRLASPPLGSKNSDAPESQHEDSNCNLLVQKLRRFSISALLCQKNNKILPLFSWLFTVVIDGIYFTTFWQILKCRRWMKNWKVTKSEKLKIKMFRQSPIFVFY